MYHLVDFLAASDAVALTTVTAIGRRFSFSFLFFHILRQNVLHLALSLLHLALSRLGESNRCSQFFGLVILVATTAAAAAATVVVVVVVVVVVAAAL